MSRNSSYNNLLHNYEEALDTIANLQMEILELKQEVDDYCQAFEELQDELSEYR
jgi:FtsZ-binding cell division protein ZapB